MLFDEVEGKCIGKSVSSATRLAYTPPFDDRYGYVIAVTSLDNIGVGKIQPGDDERSIDRPYANFLLCLGRGYVIFPVKYHAIVFRPFKHEVVDAIVTQVTKVRRFTSSSSSRRRLYLFQMGIFCKAGPLTCFISRHVSVQPVDRCTTSIPATLVEHPA